MPVDNERGGTEFTPPTFAGPASSHTEVELGACSHRGKVRPTNEDHYLVARLERTLRTLLTSLPAGNVADQHAEAGYGMVVADGMGGGTGGEVASRKAISTLVELTLSTPDWFMNLDEEGAVRVLGRIDERLGKIRDAFAEYAQGIPRLSNMGTTMTLAVSLGANLVIAHVGNSRAYVYHKGSLRLLTRDQTLAQDLADTGVIRPDEIAKHFARKVLTGVISPRGTQAQTELCQAWLADGDQLLLCTNGLTDAVTDAAIVEVLKRPASADAACRALVELALEGGGRDNVTVVLARYRIAEDGNGRRQERET